MRLRLDPMAAPHPRPLGVPQPELPRLRPARLPRDPSGRSISNRALFIFNRPGIGMFDIRRSSQFVVEHPNTERRAMGSLRTKRTDDQRGVIYIPRSERGCWLLLHQAARNDSVGSDGDVGPQHRR